MRCVILVCVLVQATLLSCGPPPPRAVPAASGLPDYTPTEAATFGDTLSSTVFGLPAELPAADDERLAERARYADTIIRVRVSTIAAESLANVRGFSISVVPEGAPLAGTPPDGPLEIYVASDNPAFARVQHAGGGLMGLRFILFVKRYAQSGQPTPHFHGEADNPEVRKAIDHAKALDAVGDRVQTPP